MLVLVLMRRVGEEIVIADNIRLAVLSVKGEKVHIGVAAPASVRVDRLEIHQLRQERQVARSAR